MHTPAVQERRSRRADRRRSFKTPAFPFYDSSGSLVNRDRRIAAERRLSYFEVEWISDTPIDDLKITKTP